jgi:uncharacterized protein (TIGR02246 family)
MGDAYNANKPAAIAALFTQDGVFLTGAGTMLAGQKQIETAAAARIQKGWTKEMIRVIQAHPEGNVVLAVIDYEITGTGANAGKQIGGYALDVLTHEGSGWRARVISATLRPVKDVTGMAAAIFAKASTWSAFIAATAFESMAFACSAVPVRPCCAVAAPERASADTTPMTSV